MSLMEVERKIAFFLALPFLLVVGLAGSIDYEVTVTTITVWVKAVDSSGQPVEGLLQDDFEIYEDQQKMTVTCFEETKLVSLSTASVEGEVEPEIPAKKFVVFLDLFNTDPGEWLFIEPKIQQFVDKVLEKKREVMIAVLLPNRKMGVVVPF